MTGSACVGVCSGVQCSAVLCCAVLCSALVSWSVSLSEWRGRRQLHLHLALSASASASSSSPCLLLTETTDIAHSKILGDSDQLSSCQEPLLDSSLHTTLLPSPTVHSRPSDQHCAFDHPRLCSCIPPEAHNFLPSGQPKTYPAPTPLQHLINRQSGFWVARHDCAAHHPSGRRPCSHE